MQAGPHRFRVLRTRPSKKDAGAAAAVRGGAAGASGAAGAGPARGGGPVAGAGGGGFGRPGGAPPWPPNSAAGPRGAPAPTAIPPPPPPPPPIPLVWPTP